jgi:hypothetical protein
MPTPSLLQRLKERKLVQWALAYLAGAWVVVQLLDAVKDPLGLSPAIHQAILFLLAIGFLLTLDLPGTMARRAASESAALSC